MPVLTDIEEDVEEVPLPAYNLSPHGGINCPPCLKCKLHLNADNPFAKTAWFFQDDLVSGLPPAEVLQSRTDWLVVLGEPPPLSVNESGDLETWKSLQRSKLLWHELGVLDRIIHVPVVRCYPPHEDGKPKITHSQLGHCMKVNFEVIRAINPKAIFAVGYDSCRALTKRGDDFNIAGRVYHWKCGTKGVVDPVTYTVIPMWGWTYVNRDMSRFMKPYHSQWEKAIKLVDSHADLSIIKAEVDYVVALDAKGVDDWFDGLDLSYPAGFDLETTSLTHLGVWDKDFTVTCASFGYPSRDKPLIIPLDYPLINAVLEEYGVPINSWPSRYKGLVAKLKEVLENPRIKKIGHNIKFDIEGAWRKWGIVMKGFFQDTMLLNYALHPDVKRLNKLDDLIRKILPDKADYSLTLDAYFKDHPEINEEYALLPHHILFPYAALDTQVLTPILDHLSAEIERREKDGGKPYFVRLDGKRTSFPTYSLTDYVSYCRRCHLLLTTEMEKNGVAVDSEMLVRIEKYYTDELESIGKNLNSHELVTTFERDCLPEFLSKTKAGKPKKVKRTTINWASTQQVAHFFYKFCDYPVYYTTDTGNPSTDESSLMKLASHESSEVAKLLLKHRETSKFVDGFLSKLTTDDKTENLISTWDGRVHASFNISNAGTGRLSCSKPNMQQIPVGGHVKRVYRSRYEGGWLLQRDYSQLEVRVLALLSRDPSLITAFLNNEDVHLKTQKFFFGDAADKSNKPQRVICKAALFGRIYGQGDKGLFENLSQNDVKSPTTGLPITLEECSAFNTLLDESYPEVHRWIEEAQLQGLEGGVTSAFGFVRPLANLASYDRWVQMKRENPEAQRTKQMGNDIQSDLRKAQNSPIQGSASDMCIFAALKAMFTLRAAAPDVKMCNLVHDSIWADAKNAEDAYMGVKHLKDAMDYIPNWIGDMLPGYDASWIDIPIIGECEIGLNAKDTFVVSTEPSDVTGETKMVLTVPMNVADAIRVDGERVGTGDKGVVLVDFLKYSGRIQDYLITKRSTL